jgi:hypothetical protein
MKMHLVALAELAIGSAVFSGCTNGDFISTSGQQQKTPAKGGYEDSPTFVDWRKDPRSQTRYSHAKQDEAEGYGVP